MMKKLLYMAVLFSAISINAIAEDNTRIPMLEQGKMWTYLHHHFEENEDGYNESTWLAYYYLNGDTVINGRQYMRMYRFDDLNEKMVYRQALREDEEGRVYYYDSFSKEDVMCLDFNLHYDAGYYPNVIRITESIKVNNRLFHRYRYQDVNPQGETYDLGYVAVEGVGFQWYGLFFDPSAPEPDCICDYEELVSVEGRSFWFTANVFFAPREIELTNDERRLIASNNDFAFNLFRKARTDESIVLSPLSITYALGLMNNGADGQTQEEINKTLGFGEAGANAINAFCQKLLAESSTLDEKTKSLIANTIFVNEGLGYRLQDDFVKKANDYYNAQPQNRDFNDGETMDVINQWASDHTEGMIPTVLDEYSFNPFAVSYLLNAIYFKGAWSSPFKASETKEESFGGGPAVPMMHKSYSEFDYTKNDLYQAVNLPYGNGSYRMTIFLPLQDKTISDVLDGLNGSNWQFYGYRPDVDLKLPRFETETNLGLVEIMSALGMPTAFTNKAEFPYFCNTPVFIGNMFQVAKIKLDEQGTEAAAVTIIEGATGMPTRVEFHATRPFLYIISEQSTGAIFFIGQYMGKIPTAIASPSIQRSMNDDAIYNLAGQRLSEPPTHGIYIQNGKKVVIK